MENTFTLRDLKTGDFVILRNNTPGVVILEKDMILYQTSGYDDFDMFNDDLTSMDGDTRFDIIRVYRDDYSALCFLSYEEGDLVYYRED